MSRIFAAIGVLLLIGGISGVRAQKLDGSWAGWIESDEFLGAVRFDIAEKAGSKVTLFYAGDKRSGDIEDLKVDGEKVTFTGKMQPQGRFAGTLSGDRMTGTFDIVGRNGTGSGKWETRRVDPADLAEKPPVAKATLERVELPAPSGKFPIGRRFFYWTDESRSEELTGDPSDKRKIFVQLWYPAKSARGSTPAAYIPDIDELRGKDADAAELRSVKTHSWTNAPIAKAKAAFPVIIFSPGLGSDSLQYASIIEDLVSHGYAVAAIEHPYDSGSYKFTDGTVIRFADDKWNREVPKDWSSEERNKFFDERRFGWARDATFVVDQLEKLDPAIGRRLDLEDLGMVGHSFGGQAASIVCASDLRFKACANLDGLAQGRSFLPDSAGNVQKQPFLFFTKSAAVTDLELKMMNMSREAYRARDLKRLRERWKPSYKTRMAELASGAYLITYSGANHTSFSDTLFLDTRSPQSYAERIAMSRVINDYVTAFFDKYLKKQNVPILDGPAANSPVIVEFLKK